MENGQIRSHRDLRVWQVGMDLAEAVYRLTRSWPKDELYGLTSQARRAASGVPANIAEGYGRESRASYLYFLRIAQGSLKELETHLELAARVQIAAKQDVDALLILADRLGKMLRMLIRKLQLPRP